jgi:hypothetical protein
LRGSKASDRRWLYPMVVRPAKFHNLND